MELLQPAGALPAQAARERLASLVVMMVLALVAIAAAGGWTYTRVRDSLKELRAAGLASLLEA
jgi:hypothetical protein